MIQAQGNGAMASISAKSRVSALALKLATLLVTALLCACAGPKIREAGDIPQFVGQAVPEFEMENLRHVSPEMQAFLDRHIPPGTPKQQRAWKLAVALTDPYILGFKYDSSLTLPPDETFRQRRGNCLSFSLMLVAMARQAKVAAQFQEVILKPEYNSINDTFVNSRHINVLLGRGNYSYLLDVSGRLLDEQLRTRKIDAPEAAAQYYNNLGVDALLENDLPAAWARFNQALTMDSSLAYLWSNLGVVLNRNGQVADAERVYRTALEVNSREAIAAANLYVIYEQEGRYSEAAQLQSQVERHRKRNPYYLAQLAGEALDRQAYDEAIDLLKRSIKIDDQEYRFHGELARAQYLAGDYDKALSSLDTARSLAPPEAIAELESIQPRNVP